MNTSYKIIKKGAQRFDLREWKDKRVVTEWVFDTEFEAECYRNKLIHEFKPNQNKMKVTNDYQMKLGVNRGVNRVWLEGAKLAKAGWFKGTRFNSVVTPESTCYYRHPLGHRAVAGTTDRPIIDTNSVKLFPKSERGTSLNVLITNNIIVIILS